MKDKYITFALPYDKTLTSNWVRAKCLLGFEPEDWKFEFIQYDGSSRFKFPFFIYWKILQNKKHRNLLLIKPNNLFLVTLLKTIPRAKIVLDINDPIHLKNHLGRFAKTKAFMLMLLADGLVFESCEYRDLHGERIKKKSTIIEDNPQQLSFQKNPLNSVARKKTVVWFGSPEPSEYLIDFFNYFELMHSFGYKIQLMGASKSVAQYFSDRIPDLTFVEKYDYDKLMKVLHEVSLSFVPMQSIEYFELRGNMKAKLSMACGCLTIASKIKMHERLIQHGKNGFLFRNHQEFKDILKMIDGMGDAKEFRQNSISNINELFNEKEHAKKIITYMQSIN